MIVRMVFFHRDTLDHKGEKTKHVIQIQNLKDALTYAEQDKRFKKGMK